jgi:hypothetical protein
MGSKHILAKSIVLAGFIVLMSGFVAYRSGAFDKYLHKKNPGDETAFYIAGMNLADTSKKPDTLVPRRQMMSGSKAMILTEPAVPSKPQTAALLSDTAEFLRLYTDLQKILKEDSIRQQKKVMQYSSKSAVVIEPWEKTPTLVPPLRIHGRYRVLTLHQVDSLLNEMKRVYPALAVPDTVKKKRSVMPSTKSGAIIRPKDIQQQSQ